MTKESSWNECLESQMSITISPDKAKARSLIDTAIGRNQFLETNIITEQNANYIFEGYYSSVLEILHAVVLIRGYKVTNHICLGYYLRDILKKQRLFRLFDDCRFKRNSLIYYGRKMEFDVSKSSISACKFLIVELKTVFDTELNL
ncbi:MAG: hypothetical protein ACI8Y7_000427 [Candidatus Woesearchaeota archaeon]|jgi:hypothetical protein